MPLLCPPEEHRSSKNRDKSSNWLRIGIVYMFKGHALWPGSPPKDPNSPIKWPNSKEGQRWLDSDWNRAELNGTNGFLQKSAVCCGFLRNSAVSRGFCEPWKCCNSPACEEKRKSANICENCKFRSFVPFSLSLFNAPWWNLFSHVWVSSGSILLEPLYFFGGSESGVCRRWAGLQDLVGIAGPHT